MAKRSFKPGGTSKRFSQIGQGLQAGRRELQEQTQRNVNALKLAKEQHKEASNIQISGLADKASFEQGILKEKQKLENSVRTRQYEALSIKADRDVDRLKGEAKEAEKYADHWAQLAPKAAKAAGKLAKGMYDISETMEHQSMAETFRKAGIHNMNDYLNNEQRKKLYLDWVKKNDKIDSLDTQLAYWRTVAGRDNQGYSQEVNDELLKNKNFHQQELKNLVIQLDDRYNKTKEGEQKDKSVGWTKDTVVKWHIDGAYMYLQMHGINPESRGGRAIISTWEKWGTLEKQKLTNQENASKTESAIATQIKSIKHEKDPVVKATKLASLANTIRLGTFQDRNGKFSIGIDNKALQVQMALEQYMSMYGEDFKTDKEVREEIEKFPQLGDEGKGEKAKGYCERHPLRCDAIVDSWVTANDKDLKRKKGAVKAENLAEIGGFDKREAEHIRNKKDDPNYQVTDEQFYTQEVDKAVKSSKGDEAYKNYVFEAAELTKGSYSEAGKWVAIQTLINQGERGKAAALFSTYTDTEREKLLPNFEGLMSLKFTHGEEQGWEALRSRLKGIHTLAEGGNGFGGKRLSDSGKYSVNLMMDRVTNRYFDLIKPGPGQLSSEDAINKAIELEQALFNEGINKADTSKYPDGDNPYARRLSFFDHADGTSKPTYIYRSGLPSQDDDAKARIIEERQLSADGSLKKARDEVRNLTITELSPETVRIMTRHGYVDYESMRKDARFMSPHRVEELREVAYNLTNGVPLYEGDINFVVPENVRVLSKVTGIPETTILNDMLKDWGHQERFQPDGQTMRIMKNGKKFVPKVNNTYEEMALNYAEAAFAQGVDPMPNDIFIFKNMMVPETNRQTTLADGTTVTLPDDGFPNTGPMRLDPKLEAFTKSLGITYDGTSISDPKAFYEGGGQNYLDFNQSINLYGLQSPAVQAERDKRLEVKTKPSRMGRKK